MSGLSRASFLLGLFESQTWAHEARPQQLLDTAFAVAPQARVIQQMMRGQDGWTDESITFRRVSGFRFGGALDRGALELLSALDGVKLLREVILSVIGDAAPESVREGIATTIGQLVARGLVIPAR